MSSSSSSSCSVSLASSASSSSHFCENFGISKTDFDEAFIDCGNGLFQLKPGWSLAFTHAVLTTGDRAGGFPDPDEEVGRAAGELWKRCKGNPVTVEECCVFNCTNVPDCKPGSHKKAGATAHVYCTTQKPQHDIRYMILIPTCSGCNNAGKVAKTKTGYPTTGEESKILYTETGAQMIFIRVSDQTVGKKGIGKGGTSFRTGEGGEYDGDFPPGRPEGAHIVG